MLPIAGFVCGFVFGWGLLISGMMQPAKVLAFLDLFGAWDASLLVVMAAALAVSSIGFAFAKRRERPLFAARSLWPDKTALDAPLIAGAVLFGIGWGLCGLCPGPAIENLATLSPRLIVFVAAMALGMVAHDAWQKRRSATASTRTEPAAIADR
jgi:uncharacterized membrane protein YedE/YeeE